MKTLKLSLPVVAFLFAIVAAFASESKDVSGTEYVQVSGSCSAITGSCNNSSSNFCKFNTENNGLQQVYDTQTSSTVCSTTLRHSLNGGVLNP